MSGTECVGRRNKSVICYPIELWVHNKFKFGAVGCCLQVENGRKFMCAFPNVFNYITLIFILQ